MLRASSEPVHPLSLLLGLYAAALPVQIRLSSGLRLAPSDLFLFLYLLAGAGRLRFRREAWSWWHYALVLAFAVGNLVTAFGTGHLGKWVWLQKDVGLLILLAAYAAFTSHSVTWAQVQQVLRSFVVSTAVLNVVALLEFGVSRAGWFDLTLMNYGTARLAGLLIDPNAYGGLLVVALTLHLTTAGKRESALVSGVAGTLVTVTLATGILLTFSRSAWLGMAVVSLGLMILQPRLFTRLVAVGLFACTILLAAFGARFLELAIPMATRGDQVDARLRIIGNALGLFGQSPLIGVGLGAYSNHYDVIIHNTVIWFLTEFGLLGLTLFCGFAAWPLRTGLLSWRAAAPEHRPLVLGLLLSHGAMLGLSIGVEALYQRHWWLIIALLAACRMLVGRAGRAHSGGLSGEEGGAHAGSGDRWGGVSGIARGRPVSAGRLEGSGDR